MEIKVITDQNYQKIWDKFVTDNSSPADFLQSWQWGEFRKEKLNEEIFRLAAEKNSEILAVALLIKKPLPLDKWYLDCPRGPVIKCLMSNDKCLMENILELFIDEIKKITKNERVVFVRIEPLFDCHPDLPTGQVGESRYPEKKDWIPNQVWNDKTIIPKILTHSKNPENTLLLDLSKTEEEILASMHPKWRYNIRLAEKKGVIISDKQLVTSDKEITHNSIDEFYKLLQETAIRDGIKIFSKKYYESLINYFGCHPDESQDPEKKIYNKEKILDSSFRWNDKICVITLFAYYQNKLLSVIMLLGFGDTLTYLHGGSANKNREVMPNHAIQWAAIKWAKENDYKWYDFWGITSRATSDKRQATSNWQGITRFKMGFVNEQTGKEINYFGARDMMINKMWYNLYRIGKIIQF